MANLNAYLTTELSPWAIQTAQRAIHAWHRIQANPSSIVIYRNGMAQAAQVVRIEFDDGARQDGISQVGRTGERDLILFGVAGHPSVTATNLKDDDVFVHNGLTYEIKSVLALPGEIQATATMRTQ